MIGPSLYCNCDSNIIPSFVLPYHRTVVFVFPLSSNQSLVISIISCNYHGASLCV